MIRTYGSTFSFEPEIQAPPWIHTTVGSAPVLSAGENTSNVRSVADPPTAVVS
jgi:hypothetical protein